MPSPSNSDRIDGGWNHRTGGAKEATLTGAGRCRSGEMRSRSPDCRNRSDDNGRNRHSPATCRLYCDSSTPFPGHPPSQVPDAQPVPALAFGCTATASRSGVRRSIPNRLSKRSWANPGTNRFSADALKLDCRHFPPRFGSTPPSISALFKPRRVHPCP